MHIAFFTNFYKPVINGVVRSISSFRRELSHLGHNVFVFAQTDNDYEDDEPFIFRYPSISLPVQVKVPAVIPVSPFVDQLLPSLKLDVIHTHHPVLLGQTAANKAEDLNLPLLFTFHTQYQEYTHYIPLPQEVIQEFLKDTIQTWLMDFMRRCQHLVIPSESMKEILVNEYGLRDRYTVIPTGIDPERFRNADGKELRASMGWQDDKVLVTVGRLGKEKNMDTLIRAVKKAHEAQADLRLIVIGDGVERNALEELAAELGIAERVTFTGEIPFSEIPTYLKTADAFGFASVSETQGLVTMEALAAGLPVVAVDGSGTRDIIDDGVQGCLVPNDVDAMAAAIIRLFESPETLDKFHTNALKKAEEFDSRLCAKKLEDVYRQAIQDKADGQSVTIEGSEKEDDYEIRD